MEVVGFDSARYPRVYDLAVDYLKSTNVFDIKVWSDWAGAKRINKEARRLNQVSRRYPHYVITLAPDIMLCLVGAIALVPQAFAEPKGKGIDIISNYQVFHYLASSIKVGGKVRWEKNTTGQLLLVGRRPENEPLPAGLPLPVQDGVVMQRRRQLPVAIKTAVPPIALISEQQMVGMDPYPYAQPVTRVMTAAEWESRNKVWLDDILHWTSTKEAHGATFRREVTSQTMPLISPSRRSELRLWAQAKSVKIDDNLFQVAHADEVRVPLVVGLNNGHTETDEVRRTLRRVEGKILSLPPEMSEVSREIKEDVNRLFSTRDLEISNFKLMLNFQNTVMPEVSTEHVQMAQEFLDNEQEQSLSIHPGHLTKSAEVQARESDLLKTISNNLGPGSSKANQDAVAKFMSQEWLLLKDELDQWTSMARTILLSNDDKLFESLMDVAQGLRGKALRQYLTLERTIPQEMVDECERIYEE
ncbi:hypothetical protein ACHAP5_005146 [Fusarium lateritium]